MSAKIAIYRIGEISPHHYLKRKQAERKVATARFRWRDKCTIEEIVLDLTVRAIRAFYDGELGVGNLLPFARSQNPLQQPERINYPIPAVGAHNRPMSVGVINEIPSDWIRQPQFIAG